MESLRGLSIDCVASDAPPLSSDPIPHRTSLRPPMFLLAQSVVVLLIFASTQVRLQSVRWWWSPTVVAVLGITPEQSAAIERSYENSLPAQRHASEEVIDTTGRIVDLIRAQVYDEQLLHMTEKLVNAYSSQDEVQQKMREGAAHALTREQRQKLIRLIAQKLVLE